MPGTPREMVAFIDVLLVRGAEPAIVDAHHWADGTEMTEEEFYDAMALYCYANQRRLAPEKRRAQRRAMRLLRGLLMPDQSRELKRLGYFHVTAPSGTAYRLDPRRGHAERVERHGRRWFARRSYCLHDAVDEGKMPPADLTIAHLLLLLADEPAFLRTANESRRDDQLWNGEYLRRMRRRHREAENAEVVATA